MGRRDARPGGMYRFPGFPLRAWYSCDASSSYGLDARLRFRPAGPSDSCAPIRVPPTAPSGGRLRGLFLLQAVWLSASSQLAVVALATECREPRSSSRIQLSDVVEEVAVVGDGHHGAREVAAGTVPARPPIRRPRWLVGSSSSSMSGLDSSSRHSATRRLLAAGQHADIGVPRRQAQRLGGHCPVDHVRRSVTSERVDASLPVPACSADSLSKSAFSSA